MYDCIVIGAGPAGLTAAIYLGRFHLRTLVIDAGSSRAALIPKTRNHAGYPEGISGAELLARMRRQAEQFGPTFFDGEAVSIAREQQHFQVGTAGAAMFETKTVLLATGVKNRSPAMPDPVHSEGIARGLIRYCPICDAYEVTDRKVAVVGTGAHGLREALFLRSYTSDVTLIAPEQKHDLTGEEVAHLGGCGIALLTGACDYSLAGDGIAIGTADGRRVFDTLYPAMGCEVRSGLAIAAGAEIDGEGCILVDAHQRTTISGLYAAGDAVRGLDQISNAMGQAAVAATAIRNDICSEQILLR